MGWEGEGEWWEGEGEWWGGRWINLHTHTYIHTYIHVYIHTYTRTYIHTYIYTHMYIHKYVCKYCIAGFFKGENFHEFHESITICENFTIEILKALGTVCS